MRAIDRQIIKRSIREVAHRKRIRRRKGRFPLETIFFFVTMRCHARCDHCFCWKGLNQSPREPRLEEIERFAAMLPPIKIMVLTGGEPFIRNDLADVVATLYRSGNVDQVTITTSGMFPERVVKLIEKVKEEFPDHGLALQVSIDALEEAHDRLRGVPGSFWRAIETLREVFRLAKTHRNLNGHVLTTLMAMNYRDIVSLNEYLHYEVHPDIYQGFEVLRDINRTAWNINPDVRRKDVSPRAMEPPPPEAFDQIAADLKSINSHSPHRADAYRLHTLSQLRMIAGGKPSFPCVAAGEGIGIVDVGWNVAHCEFTKPFANLADYDFDFNVLWNSVAADERRGQIKGCHCTHGGALAKSAECTWKHVAQMIGQSL